MGNNRRGSYCCPNPECKNHEHPEKGFFIKKGYFFVKHNSKYIPRYQCKACGKKFSTQSFSDTKWQKRPDINKDVITNYCMDKCQRDIARSLKVNLKTVARKIRFMANRAREIHKSILQEGRVSTAIVQFDEMETFEHTRKKPVTIAIAVECFQNEETGQYFTGKVIDMVAAPMHYKSRNAIRAQAKYGNRIDLGPKARSAVVESIKTAAGDAHVMVLTDGKTSYGNLLAGILSNFTHEVISRKNNKGSEYSMGCLNFTCAKTRQKMNRMQRETWATTKKIQGLQDNLDIFIAIHNGYNLS